MTTSEEMQPPDYSQGPRGQSVILFLGTCIVDLDWIQRPFKVLLSYYLEASQSFSNVGSILSDSKFFSFCALSLLLEDYGYCCTEVLLSPC